MASIRVQNILKQIGERVLLDGATIDLYPAEIAGLIGPNGAGKTTLFKLIAGKIAPDAGSVSVARSVEIGYLPQEPELPTSGTLREAVWAAFADLLAMERRIHELSDRIAAHHASDNAAELLDQFDKLNTRFEDAGGYRMEQRFGEVMAGLGFLPADFDLPVSALSGGQKCRAALAQLLLKEQNYLLLDEPTNHLDIDAVRWLEGFLSRHAGGALIISHDRYLLDRLAVRIVELRNKALFSYPGNYSNFVKSRENERLTQERQFEKDKDFIEKEKAFIARHMGSQRTAEARGRRTRLERRMAAGEFVVERPDELSKLSLDFGDAETRTGEILKAEGLAKSYGGKRLFGGLNLSLRGGTCLGLTGPNGAGKSTLLKCLLGRVEADEGEIWWDTKQQPGYFAQDSSGLSPEMTILQEIQGVAGWMNEESIRGLLGRFHFSGDDAYKRIGNLSGGEQSRVRLLKLILSRPNVLVLDEPTNHLDIAACESLEEALLEYPGTIMVISHDRYFLDQIVDQLLVIRPEGHRLIHGNYSTYVETVEREEAAERLRREAEEAAKKPAKKPAAKPNNGSAGAGQPKSRFAKLKFEQIEQEIMQRETRLGAIEQKFGDATIYRDAAASAKLREEFDALKAELAELHALWEARVGEMT